MKSHNIEFDICFIDQSPWTARTCVLQHFKNVCKYLIVHDVDHFPLNNKWGKILESKKIDYNKKIHNMVFDDILRCHKIFYPKLEYFCPRTGPPTLLGSNLLEKSEFDNKCNELENKTNDYYNFSYFD